MREEPLSTHAGARTSALALVAGLALVQCVPDKRPDRSAPAALSPCPLGLEDAKQFVGPNVRVRGIVTSEQCGYDGEGNAWVVVTVLRKSEYELQRDRSTRLEGARKIRERPETYLASAEALRQTVTDVFAYSGSVMVSVASATRTPVATATYLRHLDAALVLNDAGVEASPTPTPGAPEGHVRQEPSP